MGGSVYQNQIDSKTLKEKFGIFFFDWWTEIWVAKDIKTPILLQDALEKKFLYTIKLDIPKKSLSFVADTITAEWTSYYWDDTLYGFFSNEEDKIRFILHIG